MDMNRIKKMKDTICERLDRMEPDELSKPQAVEYAKNLASLHNKLCTMCESETGGSYMRGAYIDGPEFRAYGDGAYARGRNSMGRFTSYAGYAEGGSAKDQLRDIVNDPSLSREDRDELRRIMDRMR